MTDMQDELIPFDLSVSKEQSHVVVSVRGVVDLLTAPSLGALLSALVDFGQTDIVVDLLQVEFMDASGLGAITKPAGRIRGLGGAITIRSPSSSVRRILDIAAMGDLVELQLSTRAGAALGPEQRTGTTASDLARVAATAAGSDVIDASLRLVTALARATVGGADGVSVSLTRHGQLTTVAASDETIAQMDRDQYATGEGPCLAAASEGRWFHVESLANETRWPQFVPRALQDGIGSILSTPLMVEARPVGALNIYSSTERAFGPHDQELAALFATQASSILVNAGVDQASEDVAKRLQEALQVRQLIAQAQGVLMARNGATADEAYAELRQSSKRTEVTIRQRADDIVASSQHPDIIGDVQRA